MLLEHSKKRGFSQPLLSMARHACYNLPKQGTELHLKDMYAN